MLRVTTAAFLQFIQTSIACIEIVVQCFLFFFVFSTYENVVVWLFGEFVCTTVHIAYAPGLFMKLIVHVFCSQIVA